MIGETFEERELRKQAILDKLVDEVVETPTGLKFRNHFETPTCMGWYVIY